MNKPCIGLCSVVFLISCKDPVFEPSAQKKCVVSFHHECLTTEELAKITENYHGQDSTLLANNYVKDWLKTEYLYHLSKKNIVINEDELQQLLQNITKQYYISAYLKEYIKKNLDTSVSYQEIVEYYQSHKESFKLTSAIAQIFYVKLNDHEKEITEFRKLLALAAKDKQRLHTFIIEKAHSYFIEDSLWLKWDDIIKEMPILKNYDINTLPKGKIIEWKDGTFYYYLKLKNYKVKNDYSPITYEKNKIQKSILNERKNQLVEELRNIALSQTEHLYNKTK